MNVKHHPLIDEFPEYREQIHALKNHDRHFDHLCEKYENVDKEIVRIEQELEPTSDEYLEDQKKMRLHLKDEIYAVLKKAAESASVQES